MVLRDRRAELRAQYTNPYGESGRFKYAFVPVNNWGWTDSKPPSKIDHGDHTRKVPLPPYKRTIKGLTPAHHAVYQFFRADGRLLYAGISHEPHNRYLSHQRNVGSSEWWKQVHHDAPLIWLPTKAQALVLEKKVQYEGRALYGDGGIWGRD